MFITIIIGHPGTYTYYYNLLYVYVCNFFCPARVYVSKRNFYTIYRIGDSRRGNSTSLLKANKGYFLVPTLILSRSTATNTANYYWCRSHTILFVRALFRRTTARVYFLIPFIHNNYRCSVC